jgi:hypothetical protein
MRFLRIAVLLIIVGAAFAAASTASAAGAGVVSVVPAISNVPQGGTVDIDFVIEPPASGTSIWIIEAKYNPAVVQVIGCSVQPQIGDPGAAYAAGCDTKDTTGDLIDDTAVAFGGYVVNDGGTPRGFETTEAVAAFTFLAIGPPGSSSPLTLKVSALLGPNGETHTPVVNHGVINIVAPTPAPVGGTVDVLAAPGSPAPVTWIVALAAVALVITTSAASAVVSWRARR